MRLGFIGTGSMGSMLIRAFTKESRLDLELVACNRSPDKVKLLSLEVPDLIICETPVQVVEQSDHVFLCVRPPDARTVLNQIASFTTVGQNFYSLISAFPLSELQSALQANVFKIIPSITQVAGAGVCLVMTCDNTPANAKDAALGLLSRISTPFVIEEQDVRVCSDLTSCGPAFLSFLLQEFANASVKLGNLPTETANSLLSGMIYGLGKLLVEQGFTFADVIQRVSVPGGVTSEGIRVLQPRVEGMFEELLTATKNKQKSHSEPKPESI
ncbi:MAG: hypothetical protein JWN30_2747 [Bacilli bacterium]|nr:hypothetical protein [Bacilli bacterium]